LAFKIHKFKESFNISDNKIPDNVILNDKIFLQEGSKDGKKFKIMIIETGLSKNGFYYPADVLKEAVNVFEGANVFAYQFDNQILNHLPDTAQIPEGFSKNIAGWIDDVKYEKVGVKEGLTGTFNVTDPFFQQTFKNAVEGGNPDLLGFSIDADGEVMPAVCEGRKCFQVKMIASANSVDIVTFPSAGGKILRMTASDSRGKNKMDLMKILAGFLRENADKLTLKEGVKIEDLKDDELVKMAMSGLKESDEEETEDETEEEKEETKEETKEEDEKEELKESDVKKLIESIQIKDTDKINDSVKSLIAKMDESKRLKESEKFNAVEKKVSELDEAINKVKIRESQIEMKAVLESDKVLPKAVKEKIEKQYSDSIVDMDKLKESIKIEKDVLAKLTESGEVKGMGPVEIGRDATEFNQLRMDLMLGYEPTDDEKSKYDGVKPFAGIREAYVQMNGDGEVTGRLQEAVTSDFPETFGTSMHRRMSQEYNRLTVKESWKKIIHTENVKNFKQNDIIRIGGFGNLPVVNEDAAYTSYSSPNEVTANYSASKRGKLFAVTREMIKGDDLRAIKKFPKEMAFAANRTLSIFAYDLLLNYGSGAINGGTYQPDSTVVYSSGHANTTTGNLDYTTLDAAITAIANQAQADSNETLGLRAKYLVVPYELRSTAKILLESESIPQVLTSGNNGNNRSANPNYQALEPLIVPAFYLRSDQNNWYVTADKADIESIVIGFVDGKENPELFLQDAPTVGQVFTNDRIRYKIRHEYGGCVSDYRGLYGGLVAGIS